MSEHLQRHEVRELRDILAGIPGLVEDLLNVECRTARLSRPGLGKRAGKPGSSLPFHLGAADAADQLHSTLVGWVRVMADQKRGKGLPANATLSIAKWLHRNAEALALCEGSAEALDDIRDAVGECRRVVDIPPDDHVMIDPQRLEAANRSIVTRDSVETIAGKLGEMGTGLTARRLRTLEKAGILNAAGKDRDTGTLFYRLGDVLTAHMAHRRGS